VRFDRLKVAPGGTIDVTATFRNGTRHPIDLAGSRCGTGFSGSATVDQPHGAEGRTWSGIQQTFKDFVLKDGLGPGAVRALAPLRTQFRMETCAEEFVMSSELAAGESLTAKGQWKAEIIPGVDALPGPVPFTMSVGYDQQNGPPSYPPDYQGVRGSWSPAFKQLAVDGTFDVAGDPRPLASPGEIIDGLLADETFASWLALQPASTWSGANLFLYSWPNESEVFPKGVFWDIELFRENGVPRNYMIASVDPFDARLMKAYYCDSACVRQREAPEK
jgi:hypothetical protein